MPSRLRALLEPEIIVGITAFIAVLGTAAVFVISGSRPASSYVHPENGTVVQSVDMAGTVAAADTIDLSFEAGGRIVSAGVPVGTHVSAGQTLASVSGAAYAAQVEQAQATLDMQKAKLAGLEAGARPEDLAVSQAAVASAQASLDQSKLSVVQAAQDAYLKSDDAIRDKADQLFSNPRTSMPAFNLALVDSQLQVDVVSGRLSQETLLSGWQTYQAGLPQGDPSIDHIASVTRADLANVSTFLDKLSAALTKTIPGTNYPAATVQGYQASIASARSGVSGALAALNAALVQEKAAEAALAAAQSQLALKQAGTLSSDLDAQRAQVAAAQAALDAANAQYAKSVIRAPISGTITRNDAHAGAMAIPGVPLISMISDSSFELDAYVSEADLPKLHVGDAASTTLAAYPGVTFAAHVVSIDPAATMQGGAPAYKVVVRFDEDDARVHAGLTGSARAITAVKEGVLSVPTSAIITRNADTYVLMQTADGDVLTKVVIGIGSAAGRTEIISGISASDSIRAFGSR